MGTAVITGAGQGLGRASAERLARDGHRIVALDLDGEKAESTAKALDGVGYQCDVSDRAAVFAVAEQVDSVDVLVNNAGIWRYSSLVDMLEQDARRVLEVQLLGTVWVTQAFVPRMVDGGAIVNTSSGAAALSLTGGGIYGAAKNAIETITRQFAQELAPRRIRVNAVAPGGIITEGTADHVSDESIGPRVPLGRAGRPRDIADAVAFLVSDAASYITGQVLHIDGGLTAGGFPARS